MVLGYNQASAVEYFAQKFLTHNVFLLTIRKMYADTSLNVLVAHEDIESDHVVLLVSFLGEELCGNSCMQGLGITHFFMFCRSVEQFIGKSHESLVPQGEKRDDTF